MLYFVIDGLFPHLVIGLSLLEFEVFFLRTFMAKVAFSTTHDKVRESSDITVFVSLLMPQNNAKLHAIR